LLAFILTIPLETTYKKAKMTSTDQTSTGSIYNCCVNAVLQPNSCLAISHFCNF